ncbi:MAG: hypothetical protein CL609_04810 [Anaerolineaceae bacterium]|nr:hypothetical protein [Anaerolineaceae bacterium]
MTKKIKTLHPEGKKGVNIDYEKYEVIKDAILNLLNTHGSITFKSLNDTLLLNLEDTFEGSIPWYVITVKLDLEARHIIERIPGTAPQQIRLVNKPQT